MKDNPFYQRASDRLIARGYRGGQHAVSVGDSTRHKPPLPFERLLRAQDEGELPRVPEPVDRSDSVLAAFAEFEAERQRIIAEPPRDVAF